MKKDVLFIISIIFISSCTTMNRDMVDSPAFDSFIAEKSPGQMMCVSIPDTILTDETIHFLAANKIAGVILFSHNIINEKQLRRLIDELRKEVNPNLLIGIDQEGGSVVRIPWDPHAKITAYMIGKKNDYEYAYKIAFERSNFLLDLGINVIFGPVCDVSFSRSSYVHSRSFGSDPLKVARMVEATVRAQKDAGLITVLKHFPGHGSTVVDSHIDFPIITKTFDELVSNDFIPFIRGIKAGADAVMTGHIINSTIDSRLPASISKEYFHLLNRMGFNGLIVTDDLAMTGTIKEGIDWGLNLISGDFEEIKIILESIHTQKRTISKIENLAKSYSLANH